MSHAAKPRVGRTYSVRSESAFSKLSGYEEKLRYIVDRVDAMEQGASGGDLKSFEEVGAARSELMGLNGELEKLQLQGIDSVSVGELQTGKEEARAHRKQLNAVVEQMLPRMQELKKVLDKLIAEAKA